MKDLNNLYKNINKLPDFFRGGVMDDIDSKRHRYNAGNTRGDINNVIGALQNRVAQADNRATMGVNEIYGDSIGRFRDNINENANNTKQALARLTGLTGGDVTGAGATAMNAVDQQANENIGEGIRRYTDMAENQKERARRQGDILMRLILGGNTDLLNLDISQEEAARQRQLLRDQADSQQIQDLIGTGLNFAAPFIGGG